MARARAAPSRREPYDQAAARRGTPDARGLGMSTSLSRSSLCSLAGVLLVALSLVACEKRDQGDDPSRRGGAGAAVPGVPQVPKGVGVNADTQTLGAPYGAQDNTKPPPPDTAGSAGQVDGGVAGAGPVDGGVAGAPSK